MGEKRSKAELVNCWTEWKKKILKNPQRNSDRVWALGGTKGWRHAWQMKKKKKNWECFPHMQSTLSNTYTCNQATKKNSTHHMCVWAQAQTHKHTLLTPCLFFFQGLWLPPCLSFWLSLFQQSQLITPYCCRQLQTTTNLEFHYSKLFHMCIQGPGRLGWPRFRKKQPPTGTHPPILPTHTTILFCLSFWISCFQTHHWNLLGLPSSTSLFFYPAFTTWRMNPCTSSILQQRHKNISKDLTVGLMGEEVYTGEREVPVT